MTVKMDSVLWQFAKFYRSKFNADHPDEQIEMNVAAIAMFQAFVANGDAVEEYSDGVSTWRATQKFLDNTGLERGTVLTFGPRSTKTAAQRHRVFEKENL